MSDLDRTNSVAAHVACYALLGIVMVFAAVGNVAQPPIAPGGARPAAPNADAVQTRIDPNVAPWAELARLPDIGEGLARQIVTYREAHRQPASHGGVPPPVFRSIDDLDPVPGLGPKRLGRIARLLRFPAALTTAPTTR